MLETRTADDHSWHLATTSAGVYFRLLEGGWGVTLPASKAKEIRDALNELLS